MGHPRFADAVNEGRWRFIARLAWLPVPILLVVALLLRRLEPAWVYEPRYLVLVLSTTFSTGAGLLVAYLAARSYLRNGSAALLLMGGGMLVYALASVSAAAFISLRLTDPAVAVHNIGMASAGFLGFLSAIAAMTPGASNARSRPSVSTLAALYAAGSALVCGTVVAAAAHLLPIFIASDAAATHVRTMVLSAAVVQFALCALLLAVLYRRSRSAFLYWYSLGLALLAVGLFAVSVGARVGGPESWLGRAGQYLGALYIVIAVLAAYRDRAPGEAPLERSLRETRERYALLLDLAGDGVLVHDFASGDLRGRFREANAAACAMLGYSLDEMRTKSPFDIVAPEDAAKVPADASAVARDGILFHEKTLVGKNSRRVHAEISSSRFNDHGSPMVLSVVRDVTERRRAETFSRALNAVHSTIHSTRDIDRIMNGALARTAEALGCDTAAVSFSEGGRWVVRHVLGLPSELVGAVMSDDEEPHALLSIRTGKPVAVDDAFTDDRVNREHMKKWGIRSVLVVPLLTRGQASGVMFFNFQKSHRAFGPAHVDFASNLESAMSMALDNSQLFADAAAELSARTAAQDALEHSVRRFELLATTAGDLLQSREPQALVNALCSRVMEHLDCQAFFNFLVDEKAGRLRLNAFAGIPPEEAARIEWLDFGDAVCGCAARDGVRVVAEHILSTLDPRTDLVRSYGLAAYACHPLRGAGGTILGTLSFGTKNRETFSEDDLALMKAVTDHVAAAMSRMNAERDLREGEERLRLATDIGGIGTWYLDVRTGALMVYERAKRIYGMENDGPFSAADILERVHPADRAAVEHCFQDAVAGPGERETEFRVTGAGGAVRWVLLRCRAVPGGDGRPAANIGVVMDITARKDYERSLVAFNDELEKRVAERTVETRRLADQLRALAAQLAQVEQFERKRLAKMLHDHIQQLLVAARMQLDGAARSDGATASLAIREVDGILKEALDASRSLTVELSPPVLHEAGLNGGLGWLAAWMSRKHGFTVNFTSDGRAEPLREEMRFLLFECVRELLLNAVKHSGGREASVSMARTGGNTMEIVVEDKGRGFDAGALAARPPGETTFGLFSIQQRLAHFAGKADIDSAPGKGTRVTLTAPLLRAESPPDTPEPAAAPAGAPPAAHKNGRIRVLVVDDHAVVRQGIVGLLRAQRDIEVVGEAANGSQAVDAAEELRPDVVIMDVNMPVMNGIEATKVLRARLPQTRVIGLSLYGDENIAVKMRSAGAVDYLTKDGPAENLIASIRSHGKH